MSDTGDKKPTSAADKAAESKAAESKAAESKAAESKVAESKAAESKKPAAAAKAPAPATEAPATGSGDVVSDYLRGEIAANEKSFKMGLILFAILILIVIAYFAWMRSMLKEILQPQSLAKTLVSTIETQLPEATTAFEDGVKKVMPQIVTFVTDSVVDRGIPQMRKHASGYLDDHARATADFAAGTGTDVFAALLDEHKAQMKSAAEPGQEPGTDVLVASLESTVSNNLRTRLDNKLREGEESTDKESAAYKLHRAQKALLNINTRLNNLADNTDGSRQQQMHRRIIGAWWGWLRKTNRGAGGGTEKPGLFHEGEGE